MPSSAAEACSPASVVSCSKGCKPSRMLLPISSLGPEDFNTWHWCCVSCIGYQHGSVFFSRRPCWCTSIGTIWLRLTCRHTASRRHHTMTVGVIFALPYLDNYLFHARWWTTVTAASLLAVRSCGTVCQLHFDQTCHCPHFMGGWKHSSWQRVTVDLAHLLHLFEFVPYKCH